MAAACAMCHGTQRQARRRARPWPALAGRPARRDRRRRMAQFKAGTKPATIMHQIAKGYSDAEIAALADYFSKQPR